MKKFGRLPALVLISIGMALLIASLVIPYALPGNTSLASKRLEKILGSRIAILDYRIDHHGPALPEDMVIYRFRNDTLVSWSNQFPLSNDDLSSGVFFPRLANARMAVRTPLSDLTSGYQFVNLGPKWYLAKKTELPDQTVVSALEIANSQRTSLSRTNPRLKIHSQFSVRPLSEACGDVVCVQGSPVFKLSFESTQAKVVANILLIWVACVFLLIGAVLLLCSVRKLKWAVIVDIVVLLLLSMMMQWGYSARGEWGIFSPSLFAGGNFFYSLGALIIVNLAILFVTSSLYIVRNDIFLRVKSKRMGLVLSVLDLLAIAGIAVYFFFSLRSVVINSSICLELYKIGRLSWYSLAVFVSFTAMSFSIPMLLGLIQPVVSRIIHFHMDVTTLGSRIIYSILVSIFFVMMTAGYGFRKEKSTVSVLANRLSIERDVSLELQLRRSENRIAADPLLSALSGMKSASASVRNRVSEVYFSRVIQDYDISTLVLNGYSSDWDIAVFNERLSGGQPIADNSHFFFRREGGGIVRYYAVFTYFNEKRQELSSILIELEPKIGNERKGYSSLLGLMPSGKVDIPPYYSYARYQGSEMVSFKGNYAYPTKLSQSLSEKVSDPSVDFFFTENYIHFVNRIGPEEFVLVSRPRLSVLSIVSSAVVLALMVFLISFVLLRMNRRKKAGFERNYFQNRINAILMISLVTTLVTLALVSVIFVYRRNETNLNRQMSDRIDAIESTLEGSMYDVGEISQLRPHEISKLMESVAESTNTDVTLFSPDGKVLASSSAEVYDMMLLGGRINSEAYENIVEKCRRFFIHREMAGNTSFYSMYAPVIDSKGALTAIICAPYLDQNYDFKSETVLHLLTIFAVFIVLVFLAWLMSEALVEKLFRPISMISRRMAKAQTLESLEYIDYNRKDEIHSLVESYNMMVSELSASSQKLAQAERDKAWSGMARQVAHEIKNPLTPMKLQIQRLIRLKEKNDPQWQTKFDEATKVLLDHIEILTETANEFSTFAKLYTEEPIRFDLDLLLQEEVSMFDNRDGLRVEYIGLKNTFVMAPKPQLTRVFVNLINNAIQATESLPDPTVRVSLRKSHTEGYYDIVVEDNGPGVSTENVPKLFTPNFTTKNGGSGLGLAISRSILERCGAKITYTKSFSLGGACFTVVYPAE